MERLRAERVLMKAREVYPQAHPQSNGKRLHAALFYLPPDDVFAGRMGIRLAERRENRNGFFTGRYWEFTPPAWIIRRRPRRPFSSFALLKIKGKARDKLRHI
jgi:hypothetical protein